MPVIEASEERPLQARTIQIAPGDAHLILIEHGVRLDRGSKEHFTRPAVDPLFRSAAETHGPRVIGVLLTGAGDDGVRGLIHIKASGDLALIQDPAQAMVPSMPMNGLLYDHVDLVLPLVDVASTLISLIRGDRITRPPRLNNDMPNEVFSASISATVYRSGTLSRDQSRRHV